MTPVKLNALQVAVQGELSMLITRPSECWNAKWRPCEWFAPAGPKTVQADALRVVKASRDFVQREKKRSADQPVDGFATGTSTGGAFESVICFCMVVCLLLAAVCTVLMTHTCFHGHHADDRQVGYRLWSCIAGWDPEQESDSHVCWQAKWQARLLRLAMYLLYAGKLVHIVYLVLCTGMMSPDMETVSGLQRQ